MNRDIFINKAKLIHGDKYDYSLVVDSNIRDKFKIICNVHGIFEQRGDAHLSGQGCGKCGKSVLKTKEEFINDANIIHNKFYDYSKVDYVNSKTLVKIICPIHGEFMQTPDSHLSKHGCPKCGFEYNASIKKDEASSEFVNKAIAIFGDRFDYSKVKYVNAITKVKIICPIHGEFLQTPNIHLSKKSCCLYCSLSETKPEIEIKNLLKSYGINYVENNRSILNGREIDIYLPEYKLGIEFNGLYWHSHQFKKNDYHLNKTEKCESQGIQLLHIFEDEWECKRNIVESIIRSKIGIIDRKIYARKCEIKEIDHKLSSEFLNNNHIQGSVKSKIRIGLFYNDELVSLMTFGKKRVAMGSKNNVEGVYEMHRFCNKLNTSVIGGASKLLNYFQKNYDPKKIITFADRRYSQGNLYKQLNFKFLYNTKPNYYYFKRNDLIRYHRYNFRKDKLVKQGYDPAKTEYQIMDNIDYLRIYDSGNMKFEINYP